ncbi:MAG TPA: phage protein GemA/Gp16 family protein [Rectinemataceae bacterium]|nr:phage protein GemA/Gp16 family protein [Rectinemataceae bacterium]
MRSKASWIKNIHIAKSRIHLDDDAYHALLFGAAGISSSIEISTFDQYKSIMAAFGQLGYTNSPGLYSQRWGCTVHQQGMILAMWGKKGRHQDEEALSSFILRIAHVTSPRFLTGYLAQKVIIALEHMPDVDEVIS